MQFHIDNQFMANTSDLQSFRFVIEGIGIPIFGGIGVVGNLLRNTSKSSY